ncbi:MAG TPA: glycosyltransferase [Patescibacteria group bacterium]|nr:glycosyltransferase [Patescibacteria group bacterium]
MKMLSVIVPAYRQEKTIGKTIQSLYSTLKSSRYDYEIIVVVDGTNDKTFSEAKKRETRKIKVIGYPDNSGKGYALRYGMARSHGDVVAFIDGGTDLNPASLNMLLSHFEWYKADIMVGSKWHPVSIVEYPWWRKILSKGYGFYVWMLFGLRVRDTQLGMKLFRRNVLEDVLPRLLVKKFAADIEMLAVANRLGHSRIYEAPIELHWREIESNINHNLLGTIWDMFLDTLMVFYRLKIIKYYDNASKRKWRYDPDLNFRVNVG